MKTSTLVIVGGIVAAAGLVLAYPALAQAARGVRDDMQGPLVDPDTLAASDKPRSVRNNNPGNIIKTSINWRGEVAGNDSKFETFDNAENGIRAMLINMRTQREKHGANTVAKMILRWSATDVLFYTAYVETKAKIGANVGMNWTNPIWARVAWAMACFEAGGEYYPLSMFEKAWREAQR